MAFDYRHQAVPRVQMQKQPTVPTRVVGAIPRHQITPITPITLDVPYGKRGLSKLRLPCCTRGHSEPRNLELNPNELSISELGIYVFTIVARY